MGNLRCPTLRCQVGPGLLLPGSREDPQHGDAAGQRQRDAEELPEAHGAGAFTGRHCFLCRQENAMKIETIMLGKVLTNSKGGRFIPLRTEGGSDAPTWRSEWLRVLWNPSSFGDPEAVRVALCLEPDDAAKTFFRETEERVTKALSEHSLHDTRIFGKPLKPEEVKERMASAVKTSTRGTEFLKLKLHYDKVRFWGPQGEELPTQQWDLQGCLCKVHVELRQVLLMTSQCGVLAEVTDVMLQQCEAPKPQCPF